MPIQPIVDTESLAAFCARLAEAKFVTVDTEFLRDKTYWPILCLVQVAGPDEAAVIDALAPGIDLTPLYALMADRGILKVFHAARQDVEIFFHRAGAVPKPIFDTQVAAMVCGFGDQVAYGTLIQQLVGARIDKMSRFADWSHRPLTERQLQYALSDVTHLRRAYEKLARRIQEADRASWLEEEMAVLTDPATYRLDPEEAWRRIKSRGGSPRFFAVLREVAAWREREAQTRDLPRNRLIRDDSLLDIAAHAPRDLKDLARTRGLSKGFVEGRMGKSLLDAVARALAIPERELPRMPEPERLPPGLGPLTDLLKVLLKHSCEDSHVATRLVASGDDLERIAADDDADVPALKGWRRELFGEQALALKRGKLALTARGKAVRVIDTAGKGDAGA